MRKIIRKFFIILVLINFQTSLIAAEKATKPLSPGWSFKGFLENLIEDHCREAIRYIMKFVQHATQ